MNVEIRTRNKKVQEAVRIYRIIRPQLLVAIREQFNFEMSNCTGEYIAQDLEDSKGVCFVKTYRSRWPWSKALGYVSRGSLTININSRKLNRTIPSIVGSVAHELIHVLDGRNDQTSFGHGNNSPEGKSLTAPYWIGNKAKDLADEYMKGEFLRSMIGQEL